MEYKVREIVLKNKTISRKRIVIEFIDETLAILAEFLMVDAALLDWRVLTDLEAVLSGDKEKVERIGNRTKLTITKETTIIEDTFEGDESLETVVLETIKFQKIVQEWDKEVKNR